MVTILGKLLSPTVFCLVLMLAAAFWHKRPRLSRTCLWSAILLLFVCSNNWTVRWFTTPLEWRVQAPNPIPEADAIVVLGGALETKEWPRRSVEVNDSGDRVLYAYELFREKKAPVILCTGGKAKTGIREFSEAEDMRTMLQSFGVPAEAILVETQALDTFQNATLSRPLLEAAGVKRILLVTTAVHMPRSLETFRRQLPGFEITPAPTDYEFVRIAKLGWEEAIKSLIPSGNYLAAADETVHEYIGHLYYRIRKR